MSHLYETESAQNNETFEFRATTSSERICYFLHSFAESFARSGRRGLARDARSKFATKPDNSDILVSCVVT